MSSILFPDWVPELIEDARTCPRIHPADSEFLRLIQSMLGNDTEFRPPQITMRQLQALRTIEVKVYGDAAAA